MLLAMQIVPGNGQSPIQVGWARAGTKSYSLGDNRYIGKPVDCVQFVEAVRQLGLYWLVPNQAPPVARGWPGHSVTCGDRRGSRRRCSHASAYVAALWASALPPT